MSRHPLINQLGLNVVANCYVGNKPSGPELVLADDLEAILQKAPIRYGVLDNSVDGPVSLDDNLMKCDTHQCRILLIEPIKPPDTAESLLREYLQNDWDDPGQVNDFERRARRVVGDLK